MTFSFDGAVHSQFARTVSAPPERSALGLHHSQQRARARLGSSCLGRARFLFESFAVQMGICAVKRRASHELSSRARKSRRPEVGQGNLPPGRPPTISTSASRRNGKDLGTLPPLRRGALLLSTDRRAGAGRF